MYNKILFEKQKINHPIPWQPTYPANPQNLDTRVQYTRMVGFRLLMSCVVALLSGLGCVKGCTPYSPQSSGVAPCVVRMEFSRKRHLQTLDVLAPQVSVGGSNSVDKHKFRVDFRWCKLLRGTCSEHAVSNNCCPHLCFT